MNTNYPKSIIEYYCSNPSSFEERVNSTKKKINLVLMAVSLLLIIFPSIIPIGNWIVRIVAIIGLLYFGLAAFLFDRSWYNKVSGGKIKEIAIKKFAFPERGSTWGSEDDQRIIAMFEREDWVGLANERAADDRPMQLYIHEDAIGKTFYLQLMCYLPGVYIIQGVTDVKVINEPQYSEVYKIIKSIKST